MFEYSDDHLYCEAVALADIARKAGTPTYVYSTRAISDAYKQYESAFADLPHMICFAVKATPNLAVLSVLAKLGAGFDIVSGGELFRVLRAGGDPRRVVFSGVGKTEQDIAYALEADIHSFNCESSGELTLLDAMAARARKKARFSLRVNPDVDAATHPYISTGLRDHKFGVDIGDAEALYANSRSLPNLEATGVSCHIGSQLLDPSPLLEALDKVLALALRLRAAGFPIAHLDMGGGLGVAYRPEEQAPNIPEFVAALRDRIAHAKLTIKLEPGRSITGQAGVLLTRVLYRKISPSKEFVVVDAAMNDLIRPALYQSHHEIIPVRRTNRPPITADVVGPVCETGDFLARDRQLADALPGDLLAVMTAGAYGFSQSSNYNSRPRAAEVLVDKDQWRVVRKRETFEDLVKGEEK